MVSCKMAPALINIWVPVAVVDDPKRKSNVQVFCGGPDGFAFEKLIGKDNSFGGAKKGAKVYGRVDKVDGEYYVFEAVKHKFPTLYHASLDFVKRRLAVRPVLLCARDSD